MSSIQKTDSNPVIQDFTSKSNAPEKVTYKKWTVYQISDQENIFKRGFLAVLNFFIEAGNFIGLNSLFGKKVKEMTEKVDTNQEPVSQVKEAAKVIEEDNNEPIEESNESAPENKAEEPEQPESQELKDSEPFSQEIIEEWTEPKKENPSGEHSSDALEVRDHEEEQSSSSAAIQSSEIATANPEEKFIQEIDQGFEDMRSETGSLERQFSNEEYPLGDILRQLEVYSEDLKKILPEEMGEIEKLPESKVQKSESYMAQVVNKVSDSVDSPYVNVPMGLAVGALSTHALSTLLGSVVKRLGEPVFMGVKESLGSEVTSYLTVGASAAAILHQVYTSYNQRQALKKNNSNSASQLLTLAQNALSWNSLARALKSSTPGQALVNRLIVKSTLPYAKGLIGKIKNTVSNYLVPQKVTDKLNNSKFFKTSQLAGQLGYTAAPLLV